MGRFRFPFPNLESLGLGGSSASYQSTDQYFVGRSIILLSGYSRCENRNTEKRKKPEKQNGPSEPHIRPHPNP
jgi:hypothetical protein